MVLEVSFTSLGFHHLLDHIWRATTWRWAWSGFGALRWAWWRAWRHNLEVWKRIWSLGLHTTCLWSISMAGHSSSNVYNAFLLLSIHFPLLKNDIPGDKCSLGFGVVKPICFTLITISNEHTWFTLCIQLFSMLLWHMSICQTPKNSKMPNSRLLIIPSLIGGLAINRTSGTPIQDVVCYLYCFSPIHVMQFFGLD